MKKRTILNLIGLFAVITGLYALIQSWGSCASYFIEYEKYIKLMGILQYILGILFYILIPGKIITGLGLFAKRSWALVSAIIFLGLEFLLRLYGSINFQIASRNVTLPASFANGEDIVITTHSMIPTYMIGIISLVCVVVMIKIKSKMKDS